MADVGDSRKIVPAKLSTFSTAPHPKIFGLSYYTARITCYFPPGQGEGASALVDPPMVDLVSIDRRYPIQQLPTFSTGAKHG